MPQPLTSIPTPGPSRRASVLALMASPWLMPRVGAQALRPVPPGDPIGVELAMPWSSGRSPQGFWVSEKFDGVRAVWDGQILRFRSGRVIAAPAWFLSALPRVGLDGELWMGRGAFDRLSGVVRQTQADEQAWQAVKYLVFDAPGHGAPFAQRVAFLQSTLAQAQRPWLVPVEQGEVADARALHALLKDTVRQGGEGLMLHRADAPWQPGRTDALFKLKPFWDEEGLVVGHQAGKGRLKGQTGALWVQMPSGQRFALGAGLKDAQRRHPPPVGAWVTYRYRERTPSGLPRFASFLRVHEAE
ncbi:DNA ligase [Limnohabitans sp. G3-2]|uniref:DNA ligase n=1 Tax=Limnohabitans sp. G3-2 TaxID=1100711 RepID=UPI000CC287C2|nr:DNA ligase [Limnohabitans sp. G3-2]PIT75569.1 DNA ligase [Limnohabitans sp. G3-2]